MTWIAWLIVGIFLVILEILTPSMFFFSCLAIGAFLASGASALGSSVWLDFGICALGTLIAVYTIRPLFLRYIRRTGTVNSNVDALIGEIAIVSEDISPEKNGFVKVLNETWLAYSDEKISAGERVIVKSIDGTKLFVKKGA